ncbi:hypothetical protein V8F33_003469 [Rhypophila sp. PSN 637]
MRKTAAGTINNAETLDDDMTWDAYESNPDKGPASQRRASARISARVPETPRTRRGEHLPQADIQSQEDPRWDDLPDRVDALSDEMRNIQGILVYLQQRDYSKKAALQGQLQQSQDELRCQSTAVGEQCPQWESDENTLALGKELQQTQDKLEKTTAELDELRKAWKKTAKQLDRLRQRLGRIGGPTPYNPDHGAIVCLDNNNDYFKQEPEAPYDVKRLFDIMFLTWAELTKGDEVKLKGLRYVIRATVVNHITVSFLRAATGLRPDSQRATEVFEFTPDQDEFKALLGSPNGAGVANLLFQHKAQLGIKTITKLRVVWDGFWNMIWIIEDVPPADNP